MAVSRLSERIGALVTLAVTGTAWWMSARFPIDAQIFPRMVLGLLGVLSLLWLLRTFVPPGSRFAAPEPTPEPGQEDLPGAEAARPGEVEPFFIHLGYFLATLALLLVYVFLVGNIGYFTSTVVFMPVMALVLGYRRPLGVLLTTGIFVVTIYMVFVVAFRRRLPIEFFTPWFY